MKMPKSVTVMGRKIPVKYIGRKALDELITGADGVYDVWNRKIFINNEADVRTQIYWIFHEKGHAYLNFSGLDQLIPGELQELICQNFANFGEDLMNQKGIYPKIFKVLK